MKTIENYDVKIFTDNLEDRVQEQIGELLSVDVFSRCKMCIMPDEHAGEIAYLKNIRDTVDVVNIIKPVYNFKATD